MPTLSRNTLALTVAASMTTAASLATIGAAQAGDSVDRSDWPGSITVATASQGGTYYVYGSGWANLIADELGISGGGEITGGPTQNMALVHSGDVALGLTTMGPADQALKGESPLAPGMKMDNVCALFPMYETPFSVAALSSSGIDSIDDIPDGARIGFGPAASTSDTYFPAILSELGVDYERRNGGWSDLGSQLQDGLIDVVAFAAGIPIPAVSQLEVQTGVNFIEFTEAQQEKIVDDFPVAPFTIPASTYSTLDHDLRAVSMWNFTIANCDLPEDFVYQVVKLSMENNDRMRDIHRSAANSVPENLKYNTVLPYHPGAVRWYEENGYNIDPSLTRQ